MEGTKCFTLKNQSAATVEDRGLEHEGATSGSHVPHLTSLLILKTRHCVLVTLEHQFSLQALRTLWHMVS